MTKPVPNNSFREDGVQDRFVDLLLHNENNFLTDFLHNHLDKLNDNQSDAEFLEDCRNYWDDSFDDVVEEVKEYANSDFKKPKEDREASNIFIDINNTGGEY